MAAKQFTIMISMRHKFAPLLFLSLTCCLVGCKKEPNLVGQWVETSAVGINHEIFLNQDGTYEDRIFKDVFGERVEVRGTYSIQDSVLTATPKTINFANVSPSREKELAKTMPTDMMKQDRGEVKVLSPDSFEFIPLDNPKGKSTYGRKGTPAAKKKASTASKPTTKDKTKTAPKAGK